MVMRRLVILGAGTAGTTVANKLRRRLARDEWRITVIDRRGDECYRSVRKVWRAAGIAKHRAGTDQSQKPQPKHIRARWKAMTAT